MRGTANFLLACSAAAVAISACSPSPELDVVIFGGTVIDGTGGEPHEADVGIKGDRIVAIGNLTIKDVTKQVELPFTLTQADVRGKKKLGIETSLTINRLDYHVDYDPTGTTVSKEVKIEIDLEATEQ